MISDEKTMKTNASNEKHMKTNVFFFLQPTQLESGKKTHENKWKH